MMRKVRKYILVLIMMLTALTAGAQDKSREGGEKFSPEKFQADMEAYITKEAGLTKTEAEKFFPLYNEMKTAQRTKHEAMKKITTTTYTDDAAYKAALEEYDKLDIEQKKLQQTYHKKFLTIISAKKIFLVIKAEDNFHRDSLRKMKGQGQGQGSKHPGAKKN